MSNRRDRDQEDLEKLQRELELSTFLNKGVLQTNEEYKIQIAELERENGHLKKAEALLTKSEDKLEAAEKKLKAMEDNARTAQKSWENDIMTEAKERRRAEAERDEWKSRYKRLRDGFEAQRKVVDQVENLEADHERGYKSGYKAESSTRQSKRRETEPSLSSPISVLQPSRLRKRPKPYISSDDESDEDPVQRTPVAAPIKATTNNRSRPSVAPKDEPHQPSSTRRKQNGRASDTATRVKIEPELSPEPQHMQSDDDPLLMD